VVQSDGKILIGGWFSTYNGTNRGHVARLNLDGSLDASFLATGTGADSAVNSFAVQGDGKVLIGGWFTSYNGTSRGYVARLNPDGSLDTSFLATGAGADSVVNATSMQGDGKVLIGGWFTAYSGTSRGYVARLNTDGSVDISCFSAGTGTNNAVNTILVQSDGRIILGGPFTACSGTPRGHVARLWN